MRLRSAIAARVFLSARDPARSTTKTVTRTFTRTTERKVRRQLDAVLLPEQRYGDVRFRAGIVDKHHDMTGSGRRQHRFEMLRDIGSILKGGTWRTTKSVRFEGARHLLP